MSSSIDHRFAPQVAPAVILSRDVDETLFDDVDKADGGLPSIDPAEAARKERAANALYALGFGERRDAVVFSEKMQALLAEKRAEIVRKARLIPGYRSAQGLRDYLTFMDDLLRNGGTIPQDAQGNVGVRCPSCPAVIIVRATEPFVRCTCSPQRDLPVWQHRVPLSTRG